MNKERMLQLADHVEGLTHVTGEQVYEALNKGVYKEEEMDVPLNGFTMHFVRPRVWSEGLCGCLIPYAIDLFATNKVWSDLNEAFLPSAVAARVLELKSGRIFFPSVMPPEEKWGRGFDSLTPAIAAHAVRYMAENNSRADEAWEAAFQEA